MTAFSDAEEKSQLSLEALADLQVPEDLHISPDGKQIVYSLRPWTRRNDHPTSSIWIADIGREASARQLTSGLFNDKRPRWSPDGKDVAFCSDREKAGESSAIYLLSTAGGEAYYITPGGNQREITHHQWAPSGKFIAYLSADEKTAEQKKREQEKDDAKVWGEEWEYQRLRYVHVASRHTTTLVSGDQHVHLYSWGSDSQEIAYVLHKNPDINAAGFYGAHIERVNLMTKVSTRITTFPGPISQFVQGNNGIYFTGGVVPGHCSTARSIYRISIAEKTYERVQFGTENCCLALLKAGSSIVARVQSGLYEEIHAVSNNQPASKLLYRAMHDITAFDVGFGDGSTDPVIVTTKSDGSQPAEVFSFSVSSEVPPLQLSDHNAEIARLKISKSQPIYTTASDGYELDGVIFFPSSYDTASGPLPTVVLVHGGPYWRVTVGFAVCHCLEVPLLVSTGYAVICPNYRGGSSRGQKHAAYARGKMGTVDYTDTIAILKAGIAQGMVDQSRVAIGGWSQGGFLSYLSVTRSDFKFRAAVCGAGVVDWDMLTMTSDAYWFEADLTGGAPWDVDLAKDESTGHQDDTLMGQPASRHGSAIWHMKNATTPVLILHGEEDVRVPVSQAIAFWRACVHRGVPVKMVTYPREGHSFVERKHVIDLWSRMRQFYDLHLNS
jgi:dipeptidyl aminopeptidase/acylaminoacyl peptidase